MVHSTNASPLALDVRGQNLDLPPTLVRFARARVSGALRRVSPGVQRVSIRLSDVNGPRGGIDQRCRIAVHGADGRPDVVAEATAASMEAAIDRASRRAKRQWQRSRTPLGRSRRAQTAW